MANNTPEKRVVDVKLLGGKLHHFSYKSRVKGLLWGKTTITRYVITKDAHFIVFFEDGTCLRITVPAGYDTDAASVPKWFRGQLLGVSAKAVEWSGVLHDFNFEGGVSFELANEIFRVSIVTMDGQSKFTAWKGFTAVKLFSKSHYNTEKANQYATLQK